MKNITRKERKKQFLGFQKMKKMLIITRELTENAFTSAREYTFLMRFICRSNATIY